jgi:outer membrane protein assembly factor BamB
LITRILFRFLTIIQLLTKVMRHITLTSILLTIASLVFSQTDRPSKDWTITFDGIGIFSSPRVSDLNGDGIGDIIFGTGRVEFQPCDSAVIALDGANGKMLWSVPSIDHLFTSPALLDINGDQVEDIFVGGRSAQLMAINGKNGEVIWKFDRSQGGIKWFNFYNPQFVADQDGDGVKDLLISNGGNVMIAPKVAEGRYPGNLAVISGMTGKLLARAPMPDGKETYMSVAAIPDGKDYKVIFGSGGETIGGHLYATTLSQIMKGDLSKAKKLDQSPDKGYIAPPIWIDINNDGIHDVVANAVEGKLLAYDGKSYKKLWSVKMPGTEAYSSIAPGYFTGGDKVPDFFVTYAVGEWPDLGWSQQFMVNGATGKIAYTDSLGSYQTSTPVVIDINHDGVDEAIMNLNVMLLDEYDNKTFHNMPVIIDFTKNDLLQPWEGFPGSNLASTPWIGDLDHDGLMDLVYCHGTNIKKTYSFDGVRITRISTDIKINRKIKWGSYMGSNYDGVFELPNGKH